MRISSLNNNWLRQKYCVIHCKAQQVHKTIWWLVTNKRIKRYTYTTMYPHEDRYNPTSLCRKGILKAFVFFWQRTSGNGCL
jgi:hypothetical protein